MMSKRIEFSEDLDVNELRDRDKETRNIRVSRSLLNEREFQRLRGGEYERTRVRLL